MLYSSHITTMTKVIVIVLIVGFGVMVNQKLNEDKIL
jgi:hypothetical protein